MRTEAGPGRSKHDSRCRSGGGIDAGEPGGGEPPRRLSGSEAPRIARGGWRPKCRRAPQEPLHERRERCERQCAGIGAPGAALIRSMVQRRVTRQRNGAATALKAEARSAMPKASGAVRAGANAPALGGAGARRARREARARMGVAAPPTCARGNGPRRHRPLPGDDDAARDALRPMRCSGGPGCRAAGRGPRGCR